MNPSLPPALSRRYAYHAEVYESHARRVEQAQLLDFLVRRQQIAFHPVGKELQRTLPFVARGHALALPFVDGYSTTKLVQAIRAGGRS